MIYLFFLAKYLPPDQVKSNTFWRCDKNNIPLTIKNRSIQRKAMERPLDPKKEKQNKTLLDKRLRRLQKKLKSNGIDYDIQVSILFLVFCTLSTNCMLTPLSYRVMLPITRYIILYYLLVHAKINIVILSY